MSPQKLSALNLFALYSLPVAAGGAMLDKPGRKKIETSLLLPGGESACVITVAKPISEGLSIPVLLVTSETLLYRGRLVAAPRKAIS